LDWASSQPLFRLGFLEANPRFTRNGLPDDIAMDYRSGNRRILIDGLQTVGMSAINNLVERIFERSLIGRHPTHKKLIRSLGWVERISYASFMSYHLSEGHFRQWQENKRLVRQLGYR
jgi:hypothetical protein